MISPKSLCFFIIFFAVAHSPVAAETKVHNFDQAAISPDGKRVAWIGAADSTNTGANISGLYLQDLDTAGATPIRINTGSLAKTSIEGVAWSSDSRMLAFLCEVSEQMQVCVA